MERRASGLLHLELRYLVVLCTVSLLISKAHPRYFIHMISFTRPKYSYTILGEGRGRLGYEASSNKYLCKGMGQNVVVIKY